MKLKQYPEYKESGLPWIKKIPVHWDVLPNRAIFEERNTRGMIDEDLLSVTIRRGVIHQRELIESSSKKDSSNENKSKYKLVMEGDLPYNKMRMWQGAVGVSKYRGIVSPAYIILKTRENAHADYFHYLLRTTEYTKESHRYSYGICDDQLSLRFKDFKVIKSILPSVDEQNIIASFIRAKEKKITKFIRNKRRLIQLLKEQKQIIINQAVTRGIDPNVKMKPSGVDCVEDIPEHWDVVPLRNLGQFQNGISESAEYFGSGYPFISYGDVYSNMALPLEVDGLARSSNEERRRLSVEKGDVFFTRTSETIEEIGISSICMESIKDAVFSGFIIRFRPTKKALTKEFSKYYFRSYITREFFVKEMNIVTRASLAQDLLKRLPVLLPPSSEQKEIFDFLEATSMRIDLAIEKAHRQIELAQEYRSRLISDVVTGKVDVRNIKIEDVTEEVLRQDLSDIEEAPAYAEASAGKGELEDSVEVEQ
jgi:type I restriction enzyme S subunit